MSRLALGAMLMLAAGCTRPAALDPAGPQAGRIAELWWIYLAVLAPIYAGVLLALGFALWRGRRGEGAADPVPASPSVERRTTLTIAAASVASAAVLFVLLVASVRTSGALERAEEEQPLVVEVTGHQWWWSVRYAAARASDRFETANELHVPLGRTVQLQLAASDVIHSFWVPNLHGKRDLIPGRATELFLRVDRPGTYLGVCAEFCGQQHAKMRIVVVAEPQPAFDAWRDGQRRSARAPQSDAERRGQAVFLGSSCALCHTIRGTPAGGRIGPDLTHLASRAGIAANALPNRAASLIGWAVDPHVAKPGVRMPPNPLHGDELEGLAAYLGSLE